MKNFVVSYIDWHENELYMRTISAESELAAIKMAFADKYGECNFDEQNTVEEVKCEAFNMDSMLGVIEIGSPL